VYQALYRKWRPKTFADVIGQSHITETLQKQVAEGRTSHAYLFTGTRGTGKTTCAKILAKAVNCERPQGGNPCCQCASCLGIENGGFLDVLELDAASNNGVDQVRALRDEAIYAPAHVKKRVYIIDEVHMLSISAFNALLKILEEPPEHLMFILATTELHKVPATILSRCQRFSFKRITPQDTAVRLRYVASQENIDLTAEGAELLSRLADGALRDALSLLDQCAANGGKVDAAAVLDVLGLAGNLQTANLMERVAARDAQAALLLLDQLYRGGKDVGAVLGELSTLARDLLLRKTAPQGGAALLSGGYDAATLDRLDRQLSNTRLLYLAMTLQETLANLYYSANRRTDAELCLLRLCDEGLSGDLSALNARMTRLEERVAVLPAAIRAQAPPAAASVEMPSIPIQAEDAPPWEEAPPQTEDVPPWEDAPPSGGDVPWEEPPLPEEPPPLEEPPILEEPPVPQSQLEAAKPRPAGPVAAMPSIPQQPSVSAAPSAAGAAVWMQFVEDCKNALSPMYRAFLDNCQGSVENGAVTLFAPNELTKGRLDNDRVLNVLREKGEALTGGPVTARIVVGQPPQSSPEELRRMLIDNAGKFGNIVQIK